MKRVCGTIALLLIFVITAAAATPKIQKAEVESGGKKRTYYVFVPDSAKTDAAPMLLLLHGSGHTGEKLLQSWKNLAQKEGIILVGPDSTDPRTWNSSSDSPDYLRDVIAAVMADNLVDPQRLYIFGHSAGAMYGIMVGLLESKYFAAVASHAGALHAEEYALITRAERKIPIGLWSGVWDETVPLTFVNKTAEELQRAGFSVHMIQMPGHTHDYYAKADEINWAVWQFLKDKHNDSPEFTHYDWANPKPLK